MTADGPPIDEAKLAGALLQSSPDGLLLVAPSGAIVLANPAVGEMFGVDPADLVGTNVDVLVPAEQRQRHQRLRERFGERPSARAMGSGLRLFGQHADGSLFPVEISLSPLTVEGVTHNIATVRDVSEREEVNNRVALMHERDRIARDLHDMVIQRLFATGLGLQAIDSASVPPVVAERLSETVDDLDDTIAEIRRAIFHLGQEPDVLPLTAQLEQLVAERADDLGFTPMTIVEGDLDALPDFVGAQLVATVREGLSNMVRHANATAGVVHVDARHEELTLTIEDDGVGIPADPKRGGGLSNMMWRAAELGGVCSVSRNEPDGTRLDWRVPI